MVYALESKLQQNKTKQKPLVFQTLIFFVEMILLIFRNQTSLCQII
jgi:hypothetical protein